MNQRITSDGWYQDVRHMEFELDSDVEYVLNSSIPLSIIELINLFFLPRDNGQEMSQSFIPRCPRKTWTNF